MANQSLYRRYRPRRFSELKGQDHIVRALRTSVAEGREGQAYLFSGPRGTGKTTSARILAKVLNCENPAEGEPCCECQSCLSVEQGTSYDVHELDAASNNGVDAMRDLIEKASLGTPGRHKVYILDEVHMLSKGAEAALLKTLEEPPPHVVFVLATTDPQKMSDTIRSRTQHLQFHLLGADTLQEHVRWVAADAGLTVTDEAIEQVIAQGAGSPRDTLSALELIASTGGDATEAIALDEFVEAMIEHDPGRALAMAARAISLGRDPRTLTEELIRFMRNGFLSLMAPDLVELPSQRLGELTDLAQRAGAAGLVRGIEHLGTALTEMRQAPDPRVLLDVAIVQLTSEQVSNDVAGLVARIQKLERRLADGGSVVAAQAAVTPAAAKPAAAKPAAAPDPEPTPPEAESPATSTGRRQLGSRVGAAASPASPASPAGNDPDPVAAPESAPATPAAAPTVEPASSDAAPDAETPAAAGGRFTAADWDLVRPSLKGMTKAVYMPASFVSAADGVVVFGLPNETHRVKCDQNRAPVESAISEHAGVALMVELILDSGGGDSGGSSGDDDGGQSGPSAATPAAAVVSTPSSQESSQAPSASSVAGSGSPQSIADGVVSAPRGVSTVGALAHDEEPEVDVAAPHLSVVRDEVGDADLNDVDVTAPVERSDAAPEPPRVLNGRAIADRARAEGPQPDPDEHLQTNAESLPNDHEVDLDELIDAPPESVKTPIDRLAEAFPGSELIDDPY